MWSLKSPTVQPPTVQPPDGKAYSENLKKKKVISIDEHHIIAIVHTIFHMSSLLYQSNGIHVHGSRRIYNYRMKVAG